MILLNSSLNYAGVSNSGTAPGELSEIFNDGFESGTYDTWYAAHANVTIETNNPRNGTRSSEFLLEGTPSGDADAQFNIILDQLYSELEIDFWLYYPDGNEGYTTARYVQRDTTNNKFFRIYANTSLTLNHETLGASTWGRGGDDDIEMNLEFRSYEWENPVMGEQGSRDIDFITDADRGTWMHVVIYCKAPTGDNSNDGILRVTKNDVVVREETVNNWWSGESHGYGSFYLIGYANSGFANDTLLHIDDLTVRGVPLT